MRQNDTIIEVRDLRVSIRMDEGLLTPVRGVDFAIHAGETLGLVGESGCGKSTLGRTCIHLLESTEGKLLFQGEDVTHLNKKQLAEFRKKVQIIFQDPFSSLNPRMTIRDTVIEPLMLSRQFEGAQLEKEAENLMDLVGIERRFYNSYPHELDGGRRQRAGVARAISLKPKFVVCDEPVSALDVSIQAQILNLLMDLQDEFHLTYMFVTHDLSVVRHISSKICVMYLGQMVEVAPTKELFDKQYHPYTKALLSAIPSIDIHHQQKRIMLKGEITSPINPKPGCRFAPRCLYATDECRKPDQPLVEVGPDHFVSCCRVKEINNL